LEIVITINYKSVVYQPFQIDIIKKFHYFKSNGFKNYLRCWLRKKNWYFGRGNVETYSSYLRVNRYDLKLSLVDRLPCIIETMQTPVMEPGNT
jgi:hypothetical protein